MVSFKVICQAPRYWPGALREIVHCSCFILYCIMVYLYIVYCSYISAFLCLLLLVYLLSLASRDLFLSGDGCKAIIYRQKLVKP